jgi:hypothetical protein
VLSTFFNDITDVKQECRGGIERGNIDMDGPQDFIIHNTIAESVLSTTVSSLPAPFSVLADANPNNYPS